MHRADVHLAERTAYVREGKTGAGWVVFGERSIIALQEPGSCQITGEYVIENYDGSPLSILGAERLCTRLRNRLGKHITPHKLRYTCATAMATNGVHLCTRSM